MTKLRRPGCAMSPIDAVPRTWRGRVGAIEVSGLRSSLMDEHRIVPKPVFLQASRRPLLYFVTSSSDKLIQARLLFSKFGLELQTFQDPPDYVEDYSQSK